MRYALFFAAGAAICVGVGYVFGQPHAAAGMHIDFAATAAPVSSAIEAFPSPRPTVTVPIVVDVEGEVHRPGLQRLHAGARVADAVAAAGGATTHADIAAIDRAELLDDGKEIVVPPQGAAAGSKAGVVDSSTPSHRGKGKHRRRGGKHRHRHHADATATPASAAAVQDLNTATAAELAVVPGLDPILAERIIVLRSVDGRFDALDDLLDVQGINDARLRQLSPYVRIVS